MLLCILVTAVLCLLVSLALRNRDFSLQAFRVLDHSFRESLEGAAPPQLAPPKLSVAENARTKRPYLSPFTKQKVASDQKWRCKGCGRRLEAGFYDIDHRVPLSRGGSNDVSNLAALCRACHISKSAMESSKP